MKGRVFLLLALALIFLGLARGLYALSSRREDMFGQQEEVDLMPLWVAMGVGVAILIALAVANYVIPTSPRAPPYMGQKASMDRGEIDKTTEKAGEMKRVGGEY